MWAQSFLKYHVDQIKYMWSYFAYSLPDVNHTFLWPLANSFSGLHHETYRFYGSLAIALRATACFILSVWAPVWDIFSGNTEV